MVKSLALAASAPLIRLGLRWRKLAHAAIGRAQLADIKNQGPGCRITGPVTLVRPDRITLGHHVRINPGCYLQARGGLTIGDYTHLAQNVAIFSANHDIAADTLPYGHAFIEKPVHIGRCVWIGMNVNIAPGVTIGDGAIIGLGTTVAKDVPPMAIVVGPAARQVGERDPEHYERLAAEGKYLTNG